MPNADLQLITEIAEGNQNAFEELILKYERRVLGTIYRYIGDSTAAEDVAQEVFVKVWRNAKKFRGDAAFSTWLFRIVTNECLNFRDKRKRRYAIPLNEAQYNPETESTDEEYAKKREARLIQNAVKTLPKRQRIALVLSHFDGRSYKEIAEIMSISLSSVESLIFRAKQNLKKKLAPMKEKGDI